MASLNRRRIIITADDLGLSAENNAGIITAYRHGVVSCACLMVGGDAVEEAVEFAKQNPGLGIGLHVAFSDTKPISPAEEVSMLVQTDGRFPSDDRAHRAALLSVKGRQQIRKEIAAQFRAFHDTGLPFDHVNTHRHAHRHPLLAPMVFREAARWKVKTTRIPWDPPTDPARYLRAMLLWRLSSYHGLRTPDRSIGRAWSAKDLADFLFTLRSGATELYFHPVDAYAHQYAADLPTLLDTNVKSALSKLTMCSYKGVLV